MQSKSETKGTFGSNQSGLNTDLFLRHLMNIKKGQKREIKEYHTFKLVIAFLYWVAPKGAVCISDNPAVGNCCLLGD